MRTVKEVETRLSSAHLEAYRRCTGTSPKSVAELAQSLESYSQALKVRAEESEFLDLSSAERVVSGCRALLR